jgi:hypothetical protein
MFAMFHGFSRCCFSRAGPLLPQPPITLNAPTAKARLSEHKRLVTVTEKSWNCFQAKRFLSEQLLDCEYILESLHRLTWRTSFFEGRNFDKRHAMIRKNVNE